MELGIFVTVVSFLFGILIGIPQGWLFLASTALGLFFLGDSLSFMAGTFFHSINNYVLMAIAFFVYAGGLISDAGLADRASDVTDMLVVAVAIGAVSGTVSWLIGLLVGPIWLV